MTLRQNKQCFFFATKEQTKIYGSCCLVKKDFREIITVQLDYIPVLSDIAVILYASSKVQLPADDGQGDGMFRHRCRAGAVQSPNVVRGAGDITRRCCRLEECGQLQTVATFVAHQILRKKVRAVAPRLTDH